MELLLAYTEVEGPVRATYEAINPALLNNTSRHLRIPEGARASDYARDAAEQILGSLLAQGVENYALAEFYPPTAHPREEAERTRRDQRRKPRDIDVGPATGETVAKLTARVVTLERGYNRLLKLLADAGVTEGEEF